MSCPYLGECKSPKEFATGPIYKRRYCSQSPQDCARFQLAQYWPLEEIPLWMRPTMMAHAELLLRNRERGMVEIPAQMPARIPLSTI